MARTASTMVTLGRSAPDFELPDTISGNSMTLNMLKGDKATLIMFICNHCPFVKHLNEELVRLGNDYKNQGVGIAAISANDAIQYPDDGPEQMKQIAKELGYPFPYLYDETQEVARAYDAACTPDFFIYDSDLRLAYRGQFDDSRPGNGLPVTGADIRNALDCLINDRPVTGEQKASIGCNVKWR